MTADTERIEWLNYHHLHRFWVIARSPTMARAAQILNVSQSTLSMQLKELEQWLGQPLFERQRGRLKLNEAGRVAYEHAEVVFQSGNELLDYFRQRERSKVKIIRIGAVANLSKNLQFDLLKSLINRSDVRAIVETGSFTELLARLRDHRLDLVLSNTALSANTDGGMVSHDLGAMPVYLTGTCRITTKSLHFPQVLKGIPLFLPTRQSQVRSDFDQLVDDAKFPLDIRAEIDDMALLRLLALSGIGLALVPAIVVENELNRGLLKQVIPVPGLHKRFYAITPRRRIANKWIDEVLASFRGEMKRCIAALRKCAN